MPIEIRELIIKATVREESATQRKKDQSSKDDREEIVAECVEQVLRILREERER